MPNVSSDSLPLPAIASGWSRGCVGGVRGCYQRAPLRLVVDDTPPAAALEAHAHACTPSTTHQPPSPTPPQDHCLNAANWQWLSGPDTARPLRLSHSPPSTATHQSKPLPSPEHMATSSALKTHRSPNIHPHCHTQTTCPFQAPSVHAPPYPPPKKNQDHFLRPKYLQTCRDTATHTDTTTHRLTRSPPNTLPFLNTGPLPQRRQLAVAVCQRLLQPVLQDLLTGDVWQEVRPQRELHQEVPAAGARARCELLVRGAAGRRNPSALPPDIP